MALPSDGFQKLVTDLFSQHQEMIKELYARQDMINGNQKSIMAGQQALFERLDELEKKLQTLLKEQDSGVH